MDSKNIFNITVCAVGSIFLFIHILNLLLKKNRRKDENNLLVAFIFTAAHLIGYLAFTLVKLNYTSDALIMSVYSLFYLANNLEALLLVIYTLSYVNVSQDVKRAVLLINLAVFGLFAILDVINLFTPIFFTSVNGVYTRAQYMLASQIYQFLAFVFVFSLTVLNKNTNKTEKIAFSVYCFLPLVAIILQDIFAGYAIAYLSIVVSIEILFMFVNVQKNMDLVNESKKTKEAEVRLMMSQIQPHFIYNTLSSISTLIKIDPDKAQAGLDSFTEYLRSNLSAISETGLIPFSDELKHIRITHVNLVFYSFLASFFWIRKSRLKSTTSSGSTCLSTIAGNLIPQSAMPQCRYSMWPNSILSTMKQNISRPSSRARKGSTRCSTR